MVFSFMLSIHFPVGKWGENEKDFNYFCPYFNYTEIHFNQL